MAGPCPHSWESLYMRCHVGCGTLTGDGLTKYIQNDANEWMTQSLEKSNWFEIKNKTEDRGQSIPKSVVTYRADKLTNSKWGKFWLWSEIWPWRSRSITPQNDRVLNEGGLLHLWSKFGDSSLNGWWSIARTNLVTDGRTEGRIDGRTDGRADAGNDNTRRPKLASGKNG